MAKPPLVSLVSYDRSPPRADLVAPFRLEGAPEKTACLLLHGFGCSPYTMRGLGEALAGHGHSCFAPLLPGHGEELEEFNQVVAQDWLEAAEASFDDLASRHAKVAVVGFSMGGTLGLHLATRRQVKGLALLATPVYMGSWISRIYPAAKAFTSALPVVFDVANHGARQRRKAGVHKILPVHAVGQVLELMDDVRARLGEVKCPLLVAQSRNDHTVPPGNATYICHNVSSGVRRLIWVKRAFHVLPVDYGCQHLEHEVCRFVAEVNAQA